MDRRQFCIGTALVPWTTAGLLPDRGTRRQAHRTSRNKIEVPALLVEGLIAIPLSIGGSRPLLFEIGTAAGGVHLRRSVAHRLGLGRAAGEHLEQVAINPLRVARTPLEPRSATLHDHDWSLPPPLDGLVGLDVFGNLSLELNFSARRVRIGPAELPPPDGRTTFSYAGAEQVMLPVTIGSVTFPAIVDTGQIRAPLLLTGGIAEQIGSGGKRQSAGEARVGESVVPLTLMPIQRPAFAGCTPLNVPSAIFPAPSHHSNLGALAMQGLILAIDQKLKRVQLRRPTEHNC